MKIALVVTDSNGKSLSNYSHSKMTARKILTVTGWLLLAPIAALMILLIAFLALIPLPHMILNNINLKQFEKNFAAIEHPALTTSLGRQSVIGNLGAASNHCDYRTMELRSTSLMKEDLIAYYKHKTIPAPDVFPDEKTPVRLWFFENKVRVIDESDALFNSPTHWGIEPSLYEGKTPYIAYAEEIGAPPGTDLRCH